MLSLLIDVGAQSLDFTLGNFLGSQSSCHSFESFTRQVDIDDPQGIVIDQKNTEARSDFDDTFGLKTIDGAPQRRSADA